MICFNVVNPSDATTFLAPDRDIALAAIMLVSNGKYAAEPLARDLRVKLSEEEERAAQVPLFLFAATYECWWREQGFAADPVEGIVTRRRAEVAAALRSFAYGDLQDRRTYESALKAITCPVLRQQFQSEWENDRCSSMNRIVQRAWAWADQLEQSAEGKAA